MNEQRNIKFSTDLVTFYDPRFWGMAGEMSALRNLFTSGKWDPLRFWEHILASSKAAGLDGIEITFAPGDWYSALSAYDSAQGFATALQAHGLELSSGYFSTRIPGTDRYADFGDLADHTQLLEMTDGYAEFLQTCGSEFLVASLPLRASRDANPPIFVDLKRAEIMADLLNRMGYATLKHGVKLALHPEAFSMFRNSRDVDLLMLLSDPTYVFLCPDTAQFTVAGSNPLEIAMRHRDRMVITHWKDAVGPAPADVPIDESIYDRQIQWFAPVGTGVVDWPAWLRLLRDLNYQGWAVLELDAAPDPVGDLQQIKHYIDRSLAPIYR